MGTRAFGDAVPHALETLTAVGERLGAIVRADVGHSSLLASILIGYGLPILTINVAAIGTPGQEVAVVWAATQICHGLTGFYLFRAGD